MRRILVLVAVVALVAIGCGDDDDQDGGAGEGASAATTAPAAAIPTVEVTSRDLAFDTPAELPAGRVELVQHNDGPEEHQVSLYRLADGQTEQQMIDLLTAEGDDALDPTAFAGGPNGIPAGETNSAVVDLAPGDYVMLCFVGLHFTQGMHTAVTVPDEPAPAPPAVEADASVSLQDFAFDVSDTFDGHGTIEVTNDGEQPHEWTIAQGPQNDGVGGLTVIAPGTTAYVDLDLAPGRYTFVCFVTDPETGRLHVQEGMQRSVRVT